MRCNLSIPGRVLRLILVMLACTFTAAAQNYNQEPGFIKANSQWVFGHQAGLNLNGSTPNAFESGLNTISPEVIVEGGASVADPITGNLQFYTGGRNMMNANHVVMPNGDNLLGNRGSTTQGVCIVPVIDSPGKYYVFNLNGSTDYNVVTSGSGTLFYSVVDMSLDGGLGDVEAGRKNVLLFQNAAADSMGEAMIAIPGENCDIWLLVHNFCKPVFKAFHITSGGVDANYITSTVGNVQGGPFVVPGTDKGAYLVGGMSVSPDRQLLAMTTMPGGFGTDTAFIGYRTSQLFKFNPATGIVSDALNIGPVTTKGYVPAFSPDGTRLYFTNNVEPLPTEVVQYTISSYDSTIIAGTRAVIGVLPDEARGGYCRMYKDKVYVNPGFTIDFNFVGRIESPDLQGTAANYQPLAIQLLPGTSCAAMLPNEVVFAFKGSDTLAKVALDTTLCGGGSFPPLTLNAKPGAPGYTWDDGSTNAGRNITAPGIYWVMYKTTCKTVIDTYRVSQAPPLPPFSLGADAVICKDKGSVTFSAPAGMDSYQWQDNSTARTFTARTAGTFFVTVTENGCTASDTVLVNTKTCSCFANIPNAFSPNGDGLNDFFNPGITNDCVPIGNYAFRIFNRWGQLVYSSFSRADQGWDGKYNSQPADGGTYFYEVSFSSRNLDNNYYQKGDLTLIR